VSRVFRRPRPARLGGGYFDGYYIEYRDPTRRKPKVWEKAGNDERRAQKLLHQREAEVAQRLENPMLRRSAGTKLLAEFVEEFLATHVGKLRDKAHPARRLAAWVDFFGPGARLCDVTPARVEVYMSRRRAGTLGNVGREGKPVGEATINREFRALTAALEHARRWDLIPFHPLRGISTGREDNAEPKDLTTEQCAALVWAARESSNPLLAPFIVLGLASGGRCGELLGVKWADLVTGERPAVVLRNTKSGKPRTIPLDPEAMAELERLPRVSEWVFATADGERVAAEPRAALRRAATQAKLPNIGFHWLRHTFATQLDINGAGIEEIRRLLGHSSLTMTQRYVHARDSALRDAVKRSGAYWRSIGPAGSRRRKQRGSK